jgi:hypothetical protein
VDTQLWSANELANLIFDMFKLLILRVAEVNSDKRVALLGEVLMVLSSRNRLWNYVFGVGLMHYHSCE